MSAQCVISPHFQGFKLRRLAPESRPQGTLLHRSSDVALTDRRRSARERRITSPMLGGVRVRERARARERAKNVLRDSFGTLRAGFLYGLMPFRS